MKRSTHVSLVLMASVSAMATLSGCDDTPPAAPDNGGTFANIAECVATYDQATCEAADQLARSEHIANAPKFSRREECIAEYGADMCQPASAYGGSGDVFVPMMIGYMMGSSFSTPAPLYYAPGHYRNKNKPGYQAPIYSSGTGYARNSAVGKAPIASPTTKGTLKSGTAMTPPGSRRGGFGTTFKPTTSFKSSIAASSPSYSSRSSSIGKTTSGSSYKSATSVSSRGGFGSVGRSFGGSFGG